MIADVVDGHLYPKPRQVLRDLIDCSSCPITRLIDQLWGHEEDGGPLMAHRLIYFYIHQIRPMLRPGWKIDTEINWGYHLTYQGEAHEPSGGT